MITSNTNQNDTVLTGKKHNSVQHCITDKDRYIHVVTLNTKQDLKYKIVVKEKET